jgi:hypothetical protein
MSRALLNPKAADHLGKLCGMFGSEHDGERAAAARLADRHVKRLGLEWRDVIRVEVHWRSMARACHEQWAELNDRERRFIADIAGLRSFPSDKQLDWLTALYERVSAGAAA